MNDRKSGLNFIKFISTPTCKCATRLPSRVISQEKKNKKSILHSAICETEKEDRVVNTS